MEVNDRVYSGLRWSKIRYKLFGAIRRACGCVLAQKPSQTCFQQSSTKVINGNISSLGVIPERREDESTHREAITAGPSGDNSEVAVMDTKVEQLMSQMEELVQLAKVQHNGMRFKNKSIGSCWMHSMPCKHQRH
ncbi:hypothetical protein FNV43_RR16963 [Rhamnella rubrinervis]|uniref:Uncharacterized protein n=1 Tax=Rhamnella rubrinervis TaxID=2594499 RepID=A0A8K0GZP7_9ROSA|nr:hypothetical protein FNV43_RR16963 [Rhamnella rubrinervis]